MKTYCKQMRVDYTLFDELINVSTVFEPTRETFNKLLDSENPTVEMFQANELENEPHINLQVSFRVKYLKYLRRQHFNSISAKKKLKKLILNLKSFA